MKTVIRQQQKVQVVLSWQQLIIFDVILMSENEINDREKRVEQFLKLTQSDNRGKLKIYIGMSAGVGKTYRMLQEAHRRLANGENIRVGYIETHGRKETQALIEGLPLIPRREVFYKGKRLEELDVQSILLLHPDVVIIDELAHTNIPGSKNEKRWQDVLDVLDAGIDVISAINIQHIESINEDVQQITGIEVKERVPDRILQVADEVVNIDLTADELITRLKEGKIYDHTKVQQALTNFFQPEKILQLRELALKEVAGQVERKVDYQITAKQTPFRHERFLACISSNPEIAQRIIRKSARLASYYNSQWFVLYVQTPKESSDKIALDKQRYLINNFKNATELGAEIIQKKEDNIARAIIETIDEKQITTICLGKPHLKLWQIVLKTSVFNQLVKTLSERNVDIVILS
jgi:two-component system, OmpR family, sensor histidine kinase KdpD